MNVENLLVEAIKAGCIHRFEDLVELYKDRVYNMARHMTGCPQEAQDLAQDIFLSIYQNIHGFRGDSSLSTWIYRITLNRCLDWQRKQKRRRKHAMPGYRNTEGHNEDPLEQMPAGQPNPEEQLIAKEQIEEMRKAIHALPDKYKKVMILYYYQQMSYMEISEILDIPVRTVETRLYRGKQKIRELLINTGAKGVNRHGYARDGAITEKHPVQGS